MTTPQYTQQQLNTGQQCLHDFLTKPTIAGQYADVLQQNQTNMGAVAAWLASEGYANIDPVCIYLALEQMRSWNLTYWTGVYDNTILTDGHSIGMATLIVQGGTVSLEGTAVRTPNYDFIGLNWQVTQGNKTAANIPFTQVTGVTNQPLPQGTYIGPQFSGVFFDGYRLYPTFRGTVTDYTEIPRDTPRLPVVWQKIIQYVGYMITVGAGLQLGYKIGPWIWSQAATFRETLQKLNPQGDGLDPQTLNNPPPLAGDYRVDDPVVDPVVTTDVTAEVVEVTEIDTVAVEAGA